MRGDCRQSATKRQTGANRVSKRGRPTCDTRGMVQPKGEIASVEREIASVQREIASVESRTRPSPGLSGVGISFSKSCAFGTRSGSVRQPSEHMSMNVDNAWQDVFVHRVTGQCVSCIAAEAWLSEHAASRASVASQTSVETHERYSCAVSYSCSVMHHLLPTPTAKPTLGLCEPVLGVRGADFLSEQRLLIRRRHPLFQGAQLRIGHLRAAKICVERCAQDITLAASWDAGQLHGAAADAFVNRLECANI